MTCVGLECRPIVDPIGSSSPVPEPASIALLGAGLLGLAARRNKRR